MKRRSHTVLEPGDGLRISSSILTVNCGECLEIISFGWEDDEDYIELYKIYDMPDECNDGIMFPYTKKCQISCTESTDVPFWLTNDSRNDTICEVGRYFLARRCGATNVTVRVKRHKIDCQ